MGEKKNPVRIGRTTRARQGQIAEAGLEPARPNGHRILNPERLPIPPLGRDHDSILRIGSSRSDLAMLYRFRLTFQIN